MPCIAYGRYGDWKFTAGVMQTIAQANNILAAYAAQGFTLTLRQVYYQLVAAGAIANNDKQYNRLGEILNRARLAGLVDWDYIEDRTRNLRGVRHFNDPAEAQKNAADSFRMDKWKGQEKRVEVWVEKDALVNIVQHACTPLDVNFFSCRGYTSQSELWGAAQRHLGYQEAGQQPIVLHFSDHDPSGIDMSRDIWERFELFETSTLVERIALTMPQIVQYAPPPNPAKVTDSRFDEYKKKSKHPKLNPTGEYSWELDSMNPTVIVNLIETAIKGHMDQAKWQAIADEEAEHRKKLQLAADHWQQISDFMVQGGVIKDRLDQAIADFERAAESIGDASTFSDDVEGYYRHAMTADKARILDMLFHLRQARESLSPLTI